MVGVPGRIRHRDERRVGGDLEVLEGVVRKSVLQDFVRHRHMGDGRHVAHDLGDGVLQERAVLAVGMQDLVEPADLLFRLPDVHLQELAHLGIVLQPLDLPAHDLQCFLLERVGVDGPGDEDVVRRFRRRAARASGHGSFSCWFAGLAIQRPRGGVWFRMAGKRGGFHFSGIAVPFVYGAPTSRRVLARVTLSVRPDRAGRHPGPAALQNLGSLPPRGTQPLLNSERTSDVDYGRAQDRAHQRACA
jgi:hypothetical protein